MTTTIKINLDKRCSQCGRKGATQNGLCLGCIKKRILEKMRKQPLYRRSETHP